MGCRARPQARGPHARDLPGSEAVPCEPYLERLREETADAASGAALVAHLWSRGSLDARFDTLLLPVLLPESVDPVAHLTARGLPEDFARERLHAGGCLILLDRADAALERQYPRCIFVTDADALLQFGR